MRKWPLLLVGGLGFLAWYERDKFTIDARKLLSLQEMLAQVDDVKAAAAAQGMTYDHEFTRVVEGSGRTQVLFTTEAQEAQMGMNSYKQLLAKEKLCMDAKLTEIVTRVGWRLAGVTPPHNFQWQFNTLAAPTVNAFCLPGGGVAVYSGILPFCQNEAGLATVMAHEIAHAVARHGGERIASTGIIQGIQTGFVRTLSNLGLPADIISGAVSAFGSASDLGLAWPFSRIQETEADDLGLNYMAAAGYDPVEAVKFWDRFSQGRSENFAILSDHPASADRMDDLQSRLGAAGEYYKQSAKFGAGEPIVGGQC